MDLSDNLSDNSTSSDNSLTINIKNLDIYIDAPITLAKKFALRGVPTTIIFNKQGKEFARILGSIDFSNEEFINWLNTYN